MIDSPIGSDAKETLSFASHRLASTPPHPIGHENADTVSVAPSDCPFSKAGEKLLLGVEQSRMLQAVVQIYDESS